MKTRNQVVQSAFEGYGSKNTYGQWSRDGLIKVATFYAATVLGLIGSLPRLAGAAETFEYISDAAGWMEDAPEHDSFAFDSFFPGVDGLAALTGPTVDLNLGVTELTITVEGGNALIDGTSIYGQASDAALPQGRESVWTFSTPINGLYTYYGSQDTDAIVSMSLYSGSSLVASFSRGSDSHIPAHGHGFLSNEPIDRVVFLMTGGDDTTLAGAFVGIADPTTLGTISIPGYSGPHGSSVDLDFAIVPSVVTPVTKTTWGQIKSLYQ